MKRHNILTSGCTLSLLYLLLCISACTQTEQLAIQGVTIVDVTDGSLYFDQTVLIRGNVIETIGPAEQVRIPRRSVVVEASGKYLIPGLWDMHVHSATSVDWHFPLFLAHGVTGVREMNDGTGDVTLDLTNSIRRRLAEGELSGPPRFLSCGPSVEGDPPLGADNPVVVRTAAEARAVVDSLAEAGADFIKPYENLSREAYFALLDQARRRGIAVDGHVPFRVKPEEAAASGQRTVEHPEALAAGCSPEAEAKRERFERVLAEFHSLPESEQFLIQFRHYRALYDSRDPAACATVFETYRQHGVAVTVDLVAYHHIVHAEEILADTARMRLVPEVIRRNWQNRVTSETFQEFRSILLPIPPLELENVRLANEAGVVLLAATDTGVPLQVPGLSIHVQLGRLVEAGLTPLEALRTATLNPAQVLGLANLLGFIEAGKLADLVLLDANPLEEITNTQRIHAVIADGRLYRRTDLDRLLVEVEAMNLSSEHTPLSTQPDLVIKGATIIDGTGAPPRPGTTVIIHDGRIVAVIPDNEAEHSEDTIIIDAAGKYIIPGLVDLHAHGPTEAMLAQHLFYGVTSVLQLGGTGASTENIRDLRARRDAGTLDAPYIYGTGGHLTLHGTHPIYTLFPQSVRDAADSIAAAMPLDEPANLYSLGIGISFIRTGEAARKAVRERAAGGMDAIKITVESGPPPFGEHRPRMPVEMIREIVDEATKFGLPVFAHISSAPELETAVQGGASTIAHAVIDDPGSNPEPLRMLADNGVSVTPTLAWFYALHRYLDDPGLLDDPFLRAAITEEAILSARESPVHHMEGLSDYMRQRMHAAMRHIGEAHRAGVIIALGTDSGPDNLNFPGFSAHVEMQLLAEAGLTPMEVIVAATRRGAELLRLADDFGTLEPGKRADMLILAANPLEDIRNTRSLEVVISEGRVVDRDALLGKIR
jgi:imidazolonepropionase-like amidohydrolase